MDDLAARPVMAGRTRPPRLVLAEDDPAMRCLLSLELRRDGFLVTEVADGLLLEAVLTAATPPCGPDSRLDLIITDVNLPGQSGLAALGRRHERLGAVPVIVITAYGDGETHAAAERLGAAVVLDKPFDVDDLRALARRLVPRDPGSVTGRWTLERP